MTALVDLYKNDHSMLVHWVAKHLGLGNAGYGNPARLRREAMAQRVRLYRDNVKLDFEQMIDTVFEQPDVKRDRKVMIQVASEQNVTSSITNEVASLYDRPALRRYLDPAEDARWRALSDELEIDEVMQECHRLTFICNETLLWSVRLEGESETELHIITPDCFDIIPHPANKLRVGGVLLDTAPVRQPEGDRLRVKQYELWDDTFVYDLNPNGELLGVRKHEMGKIPGVLLHRRKPVDELLEAHSGFDIISAHLGVGLLNVMIMRLSKSQGERQPVLSGPLANVAAGQSMNGEKPLLLPPDVVAMMLDSKTEPSHYLAAKADKIQVIEDAYGKPRREAAQDTGAAFIARRLKLNELRAEQLRRARRHERLIAALLGFRPENLRVDFAEVTAPQDAKEELDILASEIKLGLSSPIKHIMRKDPSKTREEAITEIRDNTRDWGITISMLRALNTPKDAPTSGDVGQTPQQNGSDNTAKQTDETNDNAADAGDDPTAPTGT